jgi:hypothetical protein
MFCSCALNIDSLTNEARAEEAAEIIRKDDHLIIAATGSRLGLRGDPGAATTSQR